LDLIFSSKELIINEEITLVKAGKHHSTQLFNLMNKVENIEFMDEKLHSTLIESENMIEKYRKLSFKGEGVLYLIFNTVNNNYCGILKISGVNKEHEFFYLGFFVCKEERRKKIAEMMVSAFCKKYFSKSNFERIECQVHENNEASIKLLTKIGFVREGRLRKNFKVANEFFDSFVFGFVKNDLNKFLKINTI
jgi:[ribosomal protein S5]-alanine N-acetyltransferase